MKNVLRLILMTAALGTALALPAFAQDTAAGGGAAAQCTADADAMAAAYKTFLDNYKGTPDQQKTAYDTGKQYVAKYGSCPDDSTKQIVTFLQKWLTKYEDAVVKFNCTDPIAKKNYQGAFTGCRQWLSAHPDDYGILLSLAGISYNNVIDKASNKSLYPDSITYTRQALQAAESGKITDFGPFKSKDEAVGIFNYTLALLQRESSPKEAADYLLKAVQTNSAFKTEPGAYYMLGGLYYTNEVKPMVADYNAKYPATAPVTPESQAALAKVNQVLDRVIDAFARAVALSKDATTKKSYMDQLTAVYKSRFETTDGLDALVAGVLNKPIPIPGQEPPPAPMPSSSTGTTTGTDGNATPATNGAKPAATPATTTTPKPPTTQKPPVSKSTPRG